MSDENEQHENDSQADASNADETVDFEPLTATYERLRHSTDSAALSEFARRPLPDRSDQAGVLPVPPHCLRLMLATAHHAGGGPRLPCRNHAVPEHSGQAFHRRVS